MNLLGTARELVSLAARAIAIGIIANSLLKLGLVLALGGATFRRRAAIGLGVLTMVGLLTPWLTW